MSGIDINRNEINRNEVKSKIILHMAEIVKGPHSKPEKEILHQAVDILVCMGWPDDNDERKKIQNLFKLLIKYSGEREEYKLPNITKAPKVQESEKVEDAEEAEKVEDIKEVEDFEKLENTEDVEEDIEEIIAE